MKKVVIHYCGGCNPRYDRPALVKTLMEEFPQFYYTYDLDEAAELALVVCGCGVGCAVKGKENAPVRAIAVDVSQKESLHTALEQLKNE